MALSGIHWRNLDPLGEDAFAIFEAGGFTSALVMSDQGPELPLEIHRRFPSAQIIARLYWPAGDLPTVHTAVDAWDDYIGAVWPHVTQFAILNEPDTEYPNVLPETFVDWFIAAKALLQHINPNRKWGFPMASVQGEASWEYALRCDAGIKAADFIAEHCYWANDDGYYSIYWGGRYWLALQQWPGQPIEITEYGNSDPTVDPPEKAKQYRRFIEELPSAIGSAHVFIQAGAPDWDAKGFGVTESMARLILGQDPSGNPPKNDPTQPHDGNGGPMTREQRAQAFADYRTALDRVPMFEKIRAQQPLLGDPLGAERDYGSTRLQFCAGGVIGCEIGLWDQAWYVLSPKKEEDLPGAA